MEQIFGKGVSKGVAAGPISFYRRASGIIPRHEVSDTAAELERFRNCFEPACLTLCVLADSLHFLKRGAASFPLFCAFKRNKEEFS